MIKKLRVKLIIASMFSLFIVLFIIISSISILNYYKVASDADEILTILAENNGAFPIDNSKHYKDDFLTDEPPKKGRPFSPELPYESRYFSLTLDSEGNVISTNTGKIAAVDTSAAIEYGLTVWKSGRRHGFISNYRYIVYNSDTQVQIIFLDCTKSLDTFRTFVLTGIIVSVVGLLAVLFLMIVLSGRIVKPFIKNHEKQKRFITDAGHELKTPLTIIDADAEVLEMDIGENEWLSDIKNQTRRLTDLTNNLILLSRMEEEQPQTQMIDFALSDLVEEILESFQALAKSQGKALASSIEPMLTMHGDEKAISQLVTILLDNAIKYSQPKSEIFLTLQRQRSQIKISVFNTAKFISKSNLEHLFDRFYRTDQSRNSKTGGYGLGLSIAAAIVGAHKGKIIASTEDERSLLITVTFPA